MGNFVSKNNVGGCKAGRVYGTMSSLDGRLEDDAVHREVSNATGADAMVVFVAVRSSTSSHLYLSLDRLRPPTLNRNIFEISDSDSSKQTT